MIDPQLLENAEKAIKTVNECKSSKDIADLFRQEKIKAKSGKTTECAISCYVSKMSGMLTTTFGIIRVATTEQGLSFGPDGKSFHMSESARMFMGEFDAHRYPDLES